MQSRWRQAVVAVVSTFVVSAGYRVPVEAQQPPDTERFLLRAPAEEVEAVAARHGLTVIAALNSHDLFLVERSTTSSLDGTSNPPVDLSTEENASQLAIEPDGPSIIPEAPPGLQLNESTVAILDSIDTTVVPYHGMAVWNGYANQPAAQIVRLPETHTRFGAGTGIIAIIDTGVDPNHPIVAPALVPGFDFIRNKAGIPSEWSDLTAQQAQTLLAPSTGGGGQAAELNESTVAILDESTVAILDGSQLPGSFGHGTMVAGLVRLTAPDARIMPLKAFRADGSGNIFDVVRAIYYAVDHGANVISMSFGVAEPSPELMRAINYATSRNVICVGSAGNAGREVLAFPASFGNVIGVGSTSLADQDSSFSNFGDAIVRIAAPGEQLITAYPGNHYAAAWGTSFSTAVISGGISLLRQATPTMTPIEAAEFIRHGAVRKQQLTLGAGRVDLFEALRGRGSSSTSSAANAGPVASNDLVTTSEDAPIAVDVLANDTDANGDALKVSSVLQPANGTAVIATDGANAGRVVYKPRPNFSGIDSFAYVVSDGMLTAPAVVMVTVTSVNDVPVLVEDSATVQEDTAVVINVLANDTDPDGDMLTVTGVTPAANGTVSMITSGADAGRIRYLPNANYAGADSFTYTAGDGAASGTAVVTLTVTAVNDAPVAVADSTALGEDSTITIDVLSNDRDPDGDTVTVTSVTQPAHGLATLVVGGPDAGRITYTPSPNFAGADSFTYTIGDGHSATATGTVSVAVSPANDAPVAAGDAATTAEDTAVTVDVRANDTDADSDAIVVSSVGTPANGTAAVLTTEPDAGRVRYTPRANFVGRDSVSYTVGDGHGGTATAILEVTVTPVNDDPIAAADTASLAEDGIAVINVLANDTTGPDADETLSVASVTQPAHGTAALIASGADAGKVSYAPHADYVGDDVFTYTITDGNGGEAVASVAVSVADVNDAPQARGDAATTAEDSSATIDVLANDVDVDGDAIVVTAVGTPANGAVALLEGEVNAGRLRYTPNANFVGQDTVSYTIADGRGGAATAVVSITVSAVNDDPLAAADTASIAEDAGAAVINVLGNDSSAPDAGEALTVTAVTQPAHGSAAIVATGADAGRVSYTPHTDYVGQDTFSYTIADGNGGTATATVAVSVTSVNDAPIARADAVTIAEDSAVTIDVLVNDSDVDDDAVTITVVGTPANGTATLVTEEPATNRVRYTPNPDFAGHDSFSYTIGDGHGGTATATVGVTVNPVNDAPTAADDAASVAEDGVALVNVLSNDSAEADAGETLTLTAVSKPAHGTATVVASGADAGKVTYTPDADYSGADAFTYTIDDGNGGTATARVTMTISAANDAPNAVDDEATTAEDTAVLVNVRGNDSDRDGDALTVTAVATPANGTAAIVDGASVRYTPNANFSGRDTVSYTVGDGQGGTATAVLSVTITPVNDNPVAVGDSVAVLEDGVAVVDVLGNDAAGADAGETLTVIGLSQPAHGTATLVAAGGDAGKITYIPQPEFFGADSFTYTIDDGHGGTAAATISVLVTAVNDAPVAANDMASVMGAVPIVLDVLANDHDEDGDRIVLAGAGTAANGTTQPVLDGPDAGKILYTANEGFAGADTFTYSVADGQGGTATATVIVSVALQP